MQECKCEKYHARCSNRVAINVDGPALTITIFNPNDVDYLALYYTARTRANSFTYYVHSLMPDTKYNAKLSFVELVDDLQVDEGVFIVYIENNLVYQGIDMMVVALVQF